MNSILIKSTALSNRALVAKAKGEIKARSLVIFAKMIGARWDVLIEFKAGMQSAATNGKTIYLPQLDVGNDEDIELMEGLLDHEAGVHCRSTDFDVGQKTLNSNRLLATIANVLEDVWGERELYRVKPGCWRSISRALDIMKDRGLFPAPTATMEPVSILISMLLCGLRSGHLAQSQLTANYLAYHDLAEQKFGKQMVQEVMALADEVRGVFATADAIDLAERILENIQSASKQQAVHMRLEEPQGFVQENAGKASANSDRAEPASGQQNQDPSACLNDRPMQGTGHDVGNLHGKIDPIEQCESSPEACSPETHRGETCQRQDHARAAQAVLDAQASQIPSGEFVDLALEALGKSDLPAGYSGAAAGSGWIDDRPSPLCQRPHHTQRYSEIGRSITSRLTAKLQDTLESQTLSAVEFARRGHRLQSTRLVSAFTSNEVRIFRAWHEQDGLNVVVSVLTDISASMDDYFGDVVSAGGKVQPITLLDGALSVSQSLGDVLSRFDIPFSTAYFGQAFTPVKSFDQSWRSRRDAHIASTEYSTATGKALNKVIPELLSRNEERKLLMLVTDGVPDDPKGAVLALNEAKRLGAEVCVVVLSDDHCTMQKVTLGESAHGDLAEFLLACNDAGIPYSAALEPEHLAEAVFHAVQSAVAA